MSYFLSCFNSIFFLIFLTCFNSVKIGYELSRQLKFQLIACIKLNLLKLAISTDVATNSGDPPREHDKLINQMSVSERHVVKTKEHNT